MSSPPTPLTWNEALSGIFGSVSLASWIFLLLPQLLENYRQGSAEGISLTFLLIWLVGDVTNLAGAAWAKLVPTVTALAVYFCFADCVLILQCVYYNTLNRRREEARKSSVVADGETAPLLNGNGRPAEPLRKESMTDIRADNLGLPGSRRQSSHASRRRTNSSTARNARRDSLANIMEEPAVRSAWIKNAVSVFVVIIAGTAGWAVAWRTGAWRPAPVADEHSGTDPTPIGAEILGYASAVCYLGARIPQIVKNQRERSCDGLSLLFFLLSLLGNLTYGAGILFHSIQRTYVLTNLPWLIGSFGTMAEDAAIFVQFRIFSEHHNAESEDTAIEE